MLGKENRGYFGDRPQFPATGSGGLKIVSRGIGVCPRNSPPVPPYYRSLVLLSMRQWGVAC